jgi:hypothetical protein
VVFVEANPRKIVAGLRERVQVDGHVPLAARFVSFDGWKPSASAMVLLYTRCFDNGPVLARLSRGVTLISIQSGFEPLLAAHGQLRGRTSDAETRPTSTPSIKTGISSPSLKTWSDR